jgi:hypothetical protein
MGEKKREKELILSSVRNEKLASENAFTEEAAGLLGSYVNHQNRLFSKGFSQLAGRLPQLLKAGR